MISGFGKQSITIGRAPHCDLVLQGDGVLPEHARLEHRGGGALTFINGSGQATANGRALGPGEQVPFDLRTPFTCGAAGVPLNHPAISLMLLSRGNPQTAPGHLIVGRDPNRANLVFAHPSVSSEHAHVHLDRMMLIDKRSTSGTYLGTQRLNPDQPTPLDPNGVVAFGPVPVQVSLLNRIAQVMAGRPDPQPQGYPAAPGPAAAAPAPAPAPAPAAGPAAGGGGAAGVAKKNKTVFGAVNFGEGGSVKSIGRTPDNDIVLNHPQVSSRHALLHQVGGQYFLEDRNSANGTYIQGKRIPPGQKIALQPGQKIHIGPMPLQLELSGGGSVELVQEAQNAGAEWAGKPLYEIEAWSLKLEVPDRDNPATMKVLLDEVSFKALPGDMIALMGPSGAGKTTLLLTLNGYQPPTSGVVRVNGEDLYSIYDTLRGSIGYVPQDDLVHPELTVFEAVRYSAKFRLPPDFSEDEITARVEQTIKDLGLEGVKNLQIGKPEKKILSGGQRKRVNIALELVTDPVILFLDEPTSGLAADDTTALITLLSELTKRTGKTIIMTIHQPAKDEYEKFTHALIMGYGGVPMYYGPVRDSYGFFGALKTRQGQQNDVDNPRDMFEMIAARERGVFDAMKAQNPSVPRTAARKQAATDWRKEFYADTNAVYRKMYSGARAVGMGDNQRGIPPGRATTSGQLFLLLSRYFKVKVRDTSGILIMLLQAPIIGALLAVVFSGQEKSTPGWCLGALKTIETKLKSNVSQMEMASCGELMQKAVKEWPATNDLTGAIFFLVVAAVWFGTSNAAREIVSERAIYLRERMVNLGLINYVLSKYVLLAIFCVVQCVALLAIVFPVLNMGGGTEAFLRHLGALVLVALSAVSLGLLISTVVTSSEAAMALTPIALIPQVILGGLMVPAQTVPHLKPIMALMPSRWGFEATIAQERIAIQDDKPWMQAICGNTVDLKDYYIQDGKFNCAIAQVASDLPGSYAFSNYETSWMPYAVLGVMTVVQLTVLCIVLKRRDPV